MNKKVVRDRLKWLDWANVLAMVAVIWFHIPSTLELPFHDMEYVMVNVPFFLFSGYVFSYVGREKLHWKEFCLTITKNFIIPSLFFYVFFYVLWLTLGKELAGDVEDWYVPLLELACGDFNLVLATYWFVICLSTIYVIYYLLRKLLMPLFASVVCAIMPFLATFFGIPNFFQLNRAMLFLPIFALGCSFYNLNKSKSAYLEIAVVIGLMFFCFVLLQLLPSAPPYPWKWLILGLMFCAIISFLAKSIAKKDENNSTVNFLRRGVLVILAVQNYIIGFVKVMMDKLSQETDYLANHFVYKPFVLIFVYVISFPIIWFIVNKAHFVLGKSRKLH